MFNRLRRDFSTSAQDGKKMCPKGHHIIPFFQNSIIPVVSAAN
jgi:hypothetical protein